jgi:hypothetical protein
MKLRSVALCLCGLALMPTSSHAHSEEKSLIAGCRNKAHVKWDTGITAEMIMGNQLYQECLEDALIELSVEIAPDDQKSTREADIKKQIASIRAGLLHFGHDVETQNRWCFPTCGSLATVTRSSLYHHTLERMIENANGAKPKNLSTKWESK